MTLVQINTCDFGSTGKIMIDITKAAKSKGINAFAFCGRSDSADSGVECFSDSTDIYSHVLLARLGKNGHGSKTPTQKLIQRLEAIKPDVILIHNLHGYYINIKLFSDYLKSLSEKGVKIFMLLHDEWIFTGGCAYFSSINCTKYTKGCGKCPIYNTDYPKAIVDTTSIEYKYKKACFSNIKGLRLISPSVWLSDVLKQSYMKHYPVSVIHNGIDTDLFSVKSDVEVNKTAEKYNIPYKTKKIVLAVAGVWDNRKQPDKIINIAKELEGVSDLIFVMVGKNLPKPDVLPQNIIFIEKTDCQDELSEIYNAADVLINLSKDDNYPTVILESLACGTPVITTPLCGSAEALMQLATGCEKRPLDVTKWDDLLPYGIVTDSDEIDIICQDIKDLLNKKSDNPENDISKKAHRIFSKENMCNQYLQLFEF